MSSDGSAVQVTDDKFKGGPERKEDLEVGSDPIRSRTLIKEVDG